MSDFVVYRAQGFRLFFGNFEIILSENGREQMVISQAQDQHTALIPFKRSWIPALIHLLAMPIDKPATFHFDDDDHSACELKLACKSTPSGGNQVELMNYCDGQALDIITLTFDQARAFASVLNSMKDELMTKTIGQMVRI